MNIIFMYIAVYLLARSRLCTFQVYMTSPLIHLQVATIATFKSSPRHSVLAVMSVPQRAHTQLKPENSPSLELENSELTGADPQKNIHEVDAAVEWVQNNILRPKVDKKGVKQPKSEEEMDPVLTDYVRRQYVCNGFGDASRKR